jgi:hypothetical protein
LPDLTSITSLISPERIANFPFGDRDLSWSPARAVTGEESHIAQNANTTKRTHLMGFFLALNLSVKLCSCRPDPRDRYQITSNTAKPKQS